jgi:hypothetical protein
MIMSIGYMPMNDHERELHKLRMQRYRKKRKTKLAAPRQEGLDYESPVEGVDVAWGAKAAQPGETLLKDLSQEARKERFRELKASLGVEVGEPTGIECDL